jgi:hypothetical protein
MPKLVGNRYGKGRVRVLKILRDGLSQRQIYDVEGNLGPHPWDVIQRDLEFYEGSWRLSSRVSVTNTAMGRFLPKPIVHRLAEILAVLRKRTANHLRIE